MKQFLTEEQVTYMRMIARGSKNVALTKTVELLIHNGLARKGEGRFHLTEMGKTYLKNEE
jgi:hypothetical protein